MDRETKGKTPLTLPMSRWLAQERAPDTVVAWRGELRITLAQLRRDVAGLYRELNAYREKRWALCFDDCYRFTVALLASLYCGKVPIIFGHQREAILQEQRADFDALLSDLPLMLGVPRLTVEEGAAGSVALPDWPDAASLVLYTSGSTGNRRRYTSRSRRWMKNARYWQPAGCRSFRGAGSRPPSLISIYMA